MATSCPSSPSCGAPTLHQASSSQSCRCRSSASWSHTPFCYCTDASPCSVFLTELVQRNNACTCTSISSRSVKVKQPNADRRKTAVKVSLLLGKVRPNGERTVRSRALKYCFVCRHTNSACRCHRELRHVDSSRYSSARPISSASSWDPAHRRCQSYSCCSYLACSGQKAHRASDRLVCQHEQGEHSTWLTAHRLE